MPGSFFVCMPPLSAAPPKRHCPPKIDPRLQRRTRSAHEQTCMSRPPTPFRAHGMAKEHTINHHQSRLHCAGMCASEVQVPPCSHHGTTPFRCRWGREIAQFACTRGCSSRVLCRLWAERECARLM